MSKLFVAGVYLVVMLLWATDLPAAWAGELSPLSQVAGASYAIIWCGERAWREVR